MKLSLDGPPKTEVRTGAGHCSGVSTSVEPGRIAKIRVETKLSCLSLELRGQRVNAKFCLFSVCMAFNSMSSTY